MSAPIPANHTQLVADAIITRALEAMSALPPSSNESPSLRLLTALRAALELAMVAESTLHPDQNPSALRLMMASTLIKYPHQPLDSWSDDARETIERILTTCRP